MHRTSVTCNVLFLVLSVFASYVCPFETDDPIVRLIQPKGFLIAFLDLHNTWSVNFSAFLISNNQSDIIIENGTFREVVPGWWNYQNDNPRLMAGQMIRFEFNIKHKQYDDVTMLKEYKVPVWPRNPMVNNNRTCQVSATTVQDQIICAGALIFEDNFDLLSKRVWASEYRIPLDVDDADFVMYRSSPPHGHTKNGKFYFQPIVTDETSHFDENKVRNGQIEYGIHCTGTIDREKECKRQTNSFKILSPIISARINTKDSFSFRYGKIEVRAKLPKGDWLFPLITLEPRIPNYGVFGHASGQMRVAFIRSNEQLQTKDGKAIDGTHLYGGVVLNTGESDRETWLRSVNGSEHWGNDFHNYTLTWTDRSISLAYDGKTYATLSEFTPQTLSLVEPFDKEFYISIGLSAGGRSDFPDGSVSGANEKPWNNTDPKGELKFYNARHKWRPTWKDENHHLLIDHVKVWAL